MKKKGKYRSVSENMLDIISLHNKAGSIVYVSPAIRDLLGFGPTDLLGENGLKYVHKEDKKKLVRFFKHLKLATKNQYFKFEFRFLHQNGDYVWLECIGKKLFDDKKNGPGFEVISRDISERKKEEQQLIQSLQKEQSLYEMKSRFISMTSHEFRTPLAAISSTMDLLATRLKLDNLMDPFYQKNITKITDEIFKLNTMLDEILTLSSITSHSMEARKEMVDIEQVITYLKYQYFSERKDERELKVKVTGTPRMIYADKSQLSKIFTNLVGNAFKYSSKKDPTIKISYRKKELVIEITDHGIGIPASDIPHLFSPFYRGSNVDNIEGTGLGLSIVKNFIAENNGHIAVNSEENKGTTFTIIFGYPGTNA